MKVTTFPRLPILLLLLAAGPHMALRAEDKWDEKLAKLNEDYEESVRRALEPVRKRHIAELERLFRHATQAGDLDAALKVKTELERVRKEAGMAENPFIGQWEYTSGPNTYRRIIRANGTVDLWRNSKVWLNDNGKPWWDGHQWKTAKGNKIELRKANGQLVATWELKEGDSSAVIQTAPDSGKKEMLNRAAREWQ